jgi:hypothetical protein
MPAGPGRARSGAPGAGANGRGDMSRRTGAGLKRGWTPSSVRAACRVAQMNAARRTREAERVAIFWDLVEESGLRVEQLTTRRRQYSKPPECLG